MTDPILIGSVFYFLGVAEFIFLLGFPFAAFANIFGAVFLFIIIIFALCLWHFLFIFLFDVLKNNRNRIIVFQIFG